MNIAYINNRFVPLKEAKVSILDRGFLYGDGLFETMRSYGGVVFRLEEHVDRLFRSLKILGISPNITRKPAQKIIYRLLAKSGLENAYIKIIVTRGETKGLLVPEKGRECTFLAYALKHKPLSKNIYERGIKITFSDGGGEDAKIRGHKTLNYLPNILRRYEAIKKGFNDAILLNSKGFAGDATSSNIFLIKRNKLFTPSLKTGILPGIIRAEIIRISKKILKKNIREVLMKKNDLYDADEVFLTNSLTEIVPVTKIDKKTIASGRPGPLTKTLMELLSETIDRYCREKA